MSDDEANKPKRPINAYFKFRGKWFEDDKSADNDKDTRTQRFKEAWANIDEKEKIDLENEFHKSMEQWKEEYKVWAEKYPDQAEEQKSKHKKSKTKKKVVESDHEEEQKPSKRKNRTKKDQADDEDKKPKKQESKKDNKREKTPKKNKK